MDGKGPNQHVPRLTRRTLIGRAAAAGAALALPGGLRTVPAEAAPPAERLRKLISLGGSTALMPGSVHDYRLWDNRADVRATGTTWVKIWLAWDHVQGTHPRPTTLAESWAQLNVAQPGAPPGSGLAYLDAQMRAANRDGVGVVLCLEGGFPAWSSNRPGERAPAPPHGLDARLRTPFELGVESPFGWFVAHLMARYQAGAPRNPRGPRGDARTGRPSTWGNPAGAFVNGIEVCNEPNLLSWPQSLAPERTAAMMRTADAWSARLLGPPVLGPAASDAVTRSGERATEFSEFLGAVLDRLEGWRPRGLVSFSHHNYADMRDGTADRTRHLLDALERRGWRDDLVWITEGGYDLSRRGTPQTVAPKPQLARQVRAIADGFAACAALTRERAGRTRPHTFAQHTVNDPPTNPFKSGLRDDFTPSPARVGARRPAWYAWRDLPASREV